MSKDNQIFECSKCGAQAHKWAGRCGECGAWGAMQESSGAEIKAKKVINTKPGKVVGFDQVENKDIDRIKTDISEFDRVMGGGIVPGSLTLLGGEPGIGKSTLILQVVEKISLKTNNAPTLYVSGEESAQQIKLRLDRLSLNPKNIKFLGDTLVETVIATIKDTKPSFVIVDSIQTIVSSDIPSEAGNVSQIRACTVKLLELSKQTSIPIFIIGHITKDGSVAGPKTLEHLVDTVLYLEGDRYHHFRLLRTIKNRFGATNEVGVFDMQSNGLVEIKNPSSVFIQDRKENIAGSVTTVLMEGTRPFLIEVQALVNSTAFGLPQRRSSGFDLNRLQLLIAVLSKRCNIKLFNQDVTINIAGGFKVTEPAIDLAVSLAIVSAFTGKPISNKTVVIGEIGLSGEVRNVNHLPARIKEVEKLGFTDVITSNSVKVDSDGINILKVKNLEEALNNI